MTSLKESYLDASARPAFAERYPPGLMSPWYPACFGLILLVWTHYLKEDYFGARAHSAFAGSHPTWLPPDTPCFRLLLAVGTSIYLRPGSLWHTLLLSSFSRRNLHYWSLFEASWNPWSHEHLQISVYREAEFLSSFRCHLSFWVASGATCRYPTPIPHTESFWVNSSCCRLWPSVLWVLCVSFI